MSLVEYARKQIKKGMKIAFPGDMLPPFLAKSNLVFFTKCDEFKKDETRDFPDDFPQVCALKTQMWHEGHQHEVTLRLLSQQ